MRQEPVSNDGPEIVESDKDRVIQVIEEDERYRNFLAYVSEGNDTEVEQKIQYWRTELQAKPEADKGQMRVLECGIRWAIEQKQRRQDGREQRRQGEQGQSKRGKQVRFGEEEQLEETREESTDELEVTGRSAEVQTGRGSAGLVRGRDVGRTRPAGKAEERVTEERVNMKAKEGDLAAKENSKRRGRKRRNGCEWRQTWRRVAHTPRPCRIQERTRWRKVSNSAMRKRKRF